MEDPADLVRRCLHVAGMHAGTDLVERLRNAIESQELQRAALRDAAAECARLYEENVRLRAQLLPATGEDCKHPPGAA